MPCFFSDDSLRYLPTLNAINVSAASVTKSMPPIISAGISLSTLGPMSTPDIIYPVTLGSLSSLVMRVSANAASQIRLSVISIAATALA